MVIVSKDVTDPGAKPFIVADHVVSNADGSISFALDAAETRFAGQEPFQYGVRNDSTGAPGSYQRFTRQGALVAVVMPPPNSPPSWFVYTMAEGKVY